MREQGDAVILRRPQTGTYFNVIPENNMERRTFIGAAAATLALTAAAQLAAAPLTAADQGDYVLLDQNEKHTHAHAHGAAAATGKVNEDLLKATAACLAAGRVCLNHCINQLAAGDKTMEACAKAANQMLALCDATNNLAAQNAPLLAAVAKQCAEACKQCADHHAECKACHEACLECADACNKAAA